MIRYTYDSAGNRTSMQTPYGTTTYTYDALNRLATVVDASGTTTYGYDRVGNLISVVYPNQVEAAYAYDDLNRLIQQTTSGRAGLIASFTYVLDPMGKRTTVTEAGPGTNGRTVRYAYDTVNHLLNETIVAGGATQQSVSYTYDSVGNRLTKTVHASNQTLFTNYTYDDNDRLLTEVSSTQSADNRSPLDGLSLALAGIAFSPLVIGFVFVGARTRRRDLAPSPSRACPVKGYVVFVLVTAQLLIPLSDSAGRAGWLGAVALDAKAATTISYTYDDNGNLLTQSDGSSISSYAYNAENRLVGAATYAGASNAAMTYAYDADGLLTSKTVNGVTTTILMDKNGELPQVVAEVTGSDIVTYTYGLDRISQTRSGSGTRFYQYDGQHSVRELTDAAGVVSDTYTYDAFGLLLARTGTTANDYLYAGERFDPNIGFYYLRARYYNPASGRFLTVDPFDGSIFDPPSLHRYLYANADPIDGRDPTGEFTMIEMMNVCAIVGVLVGIGAFASGHPVVGTVSFLIAAVLVTRGRMLSAEIEAAAARQARLAAGRETQRQILEGLRVNVQEGGRAVETESVFEQFGKKAAQALLPPTLLEQQDTGPAIR